MALNMRFSKRNNKVLVIEDDIMREKNKGKKKYLEQNAKLDKVEILRYDGGSIKSIGGEINLPNLKTIRLDANAYSGNFDKGCIGTKNKDSVKVVGKGKNNNGVEKMLDLPPGTIR